LHYEEYHLCCNQRLIPPHIYVDWLGSLLEESARSDQTRPPLDIKPYVTPYTDVDFRNFITDILKMNSKDREGISNRVYVEIHREERHPKRTR
jgi:hypothetical protein